LELHQTFCQVSRLRYGHPAEIFQIVGRRYVIEELPRQHVSASFEIKYIYLIRISLLFVLAPIGSTQNS
jgi:hypothetical protein